MTCAIVTNHAEKRIRQRVGVLKGVAEKNAARALENGLTHSDLNGSILRYVDSLWFRNEEVNGIRVYCHNVYLFKGSVLITVIPLPQKYRKQADALTKKKKERA